MNKIVFGISKIILAILILVYAFSATGAQKGLSIWVGCVIALPITLWGILDFVKNAKKDDEDEE